MDLIYYPTVRVELVVTKPLSYKVQRAHEKGKGIMIVEPLVSSINFLVINIDLVPKGPKVPKYEY